ncbi:ABC transporter permease [Streptococcus caprae]|uniref:ABC transporter permease n=1 Tax=Streptococcus caprae TaxID=1640501 RepID=A0ABV8CWS6_9STRE
MKRYIFNRVLRSLVSIFLVTTLIYAIIFALVPRHKIFNQDSNYSKMAAKPDQKTDYENTVYENMGYIDYLNAKELQKGASESDSSVTVEVTDANKAIYEKYVKSLGNGWTLKQLPESKTFYATREIPLYERIFDFYSHLIQIDHPWKIKDKENPDLERYVRIENDPSIGWSVVGSGTKHKYLLYFNGSFPYIHQNFVTLNLGNSYPTYQGYSVLQVITQGQGKTESKEVTFPTGVTKNSSINIYSRTYKNPNSLDAQTIANFGKGDAYTATTNNYKDPSMLFSSSVVGLVGVILSYLIGIPLGVYMARFKDTWFDSLGTMGMTFMLAVPSIATIYVIRFLTGLIGWPDAFPTLGADDWRSYAGPALVLAVLGIPGLAVWVRRYLIDQQLSDYVRFARAKGLSEKEISNNHIFKNSMVPIVANIPGAIVGVIVGATLTEKIYAFPGMGKTLIDGIQASNNNMVVGLSFIFSALGILAVMLGDILMTVLDPRIKLATKGGK